MAKASLRSQGRRRTASVSRPSRQVLDIVDPRRGGPAPYLPQWLEFAALANATPADAPIVWPAFAAGEQRRAAGFAEMLEARVAVIAGLRINFRCRARLPDLRSGTEHRHPVRRARQVLTIGAVADRYFRRVDVGLVADPPAMALPVDFHARQLRLANGGPIARTKTAPEGAVLS